jgi:hypothetical protein
MMPVLRIVDVRNCHVCPSKPCLPQSYSASRRTASHAGFFILSQSGDRPDRYCESLRFETMPSNTISPSLCSRCSFSRRPGLSERNVRIWGRIVRRDRRLVAALWAKLTAAAIGTLGPRRDQASVLVSGLTLDAIVNVAPRANPFSHLLHVTSPALPPWRPVPR